MEKKQYTFAEVAQHNGNNGSRVWIILWGNVYDVTDYMEQHPGGSELITEYAGIDATKGFDDFGHSSDAKKMLKKYEIGIVAKTENIKNNKNKSDVNGETKDIMTKRENSKQRRKFLSIILGPCAST